MELNLKDYLDVVRRRKMVFFQTFALVLAIGLIVTALSKPVYRTSAKLLVPTAPVAMSLVDQSNPLNNIMAPTQMDSVSTQLQLLQSGPFLQKARLMARVSNDPNVIPPTAHAEIVEGTNVIQVIVEGGNPNEIKRLADAMVKLHIEQMGTYTGERVVEARDWVEEEWKRARKVLSAAETALFDFKQRNKVAVLQMRDQMDARELVDLESRVREAQSNVTTTNAKILEFRARLRAEPKYTVEEGTKPNPTKDRIQARLDDLQLTRGDLVNQFRETSRPVRELDSQISELKDRLKNTPDDLPIHTRTANPTYAWIQTRLNELETSLSGYQQDYNAAASRYQTTKNKVSGTGPWEITLNRLTSDRDAAQSAYAKLTTQLQDLELRVRTKPLAARQIETAGVPSTPVRPRKSVNIMLSLVLALFLGAGMAFLQEYLDDRVNTPEDVERVTALPTLGHVPFMGADQSRLVTGMAANSHVAEAYRAVRSGIGFAALDAPIRRLQVTSASKGEGKSTTSINLATAMAMDGKKVILVDADLRRPSLHRIMGISNTGLSEVLVAMKSLDDALQPTEIENLQVLCAGPIPPNPAELLGSQAFERVIEQLEERADVVIFDTPPCIPVTDPLIVAARMDAVVLVLHAGQTRKAAIRHVVEQLGRARARIIGIIFNRVQPKKSGYYYYHYYYSGDGYYAEAADRGDRHRRNGKRHKPELESGKSVVAARHGDEDDV
jgi:capsular exopolysaccharide synthesis family protein